MDGHSLTIDGDVKMCGTLYMDEDSQFTVNGNLHHYDGVLFVNYGKVNVTGNYHLAGEDSTAGSYTECGAWLRMIRDDEVHVGGDFISAGRLEFTNGVLYVGGDFRLLSDANMLNRHTTVLNGTQEQTVSFSGDESGFGTLVSTNPDLVFENYVNWDRLGSDITARSNQAVLGGVHKNSLVNSGVDFDGHSLSVEGDITLTSGLFLNGGVFSVNGTLYHRENVLSVGSGAVTITGDYILTGENGEACTGVLYQWNEEGTVRVGGNVVIHSDLSRHLTGGAMYVGGNFTQYARFEIPSSHITVLDGKQLQTVNLGEETNHFGTLVLPNSATQYSLTPSPCWLSLVGPLPFAAPDFILPEALTRIEEYAFEGISAEVCYIPDSCESIGVRAFYDSALKLIRIPAGCTVEAVAFSGGSNDLIIFGTPGSLLLRLQQLQIRKRRVADSWVMPSARSDYRIREAASKNKRSKYPSRTPYKKRASGVFSPGAFLLSHCVGLVDLADHVHHGLGGFGVVFL